MEKVDLVPRRCHDDAASHHFHAVDLRRTPRLAQHSHARFTQGCSLNRMPQDVPIARLQDNSAPASDDWLLHSDQLYVREPRNSQSL